MSERDEFERFVTDKFFDIEKDHIGYTSWVTQFAWKVWQDTRAAARAPQAVPALTLTDADIERQYEDGICLGSGIRRETCPCGFCRKYRTPRPLAAPQPSPEPRRYQD